MKKTALLPILAVILFLLPLREVSADVKLPRVLGSHMVVQQGQPLPIWGFADKGEKVTVEFAGKEQSATTDSDGRWKVVFPPMKADGKAHRLTVSGNNKIELEDILIGEVWIGSGQSNMQWALSNTYGSKEAIAAAKLPKVRLFYVPRVQSKQPATDVSATWNVCSPKTVPGFSATLYYFGLKLHKELGVPVGLINSSWGGSRIEPWTINGKGSGGMYNGMIAPIQPVSMRGVVWYQGESNVNNGYAYYGKMKDLISGWRKVWDREFPFYFVQIAPYSRYGKGRLPQLWEAQVASLKIPKTGMIVTTDLVDNVNDIHPRNKRDVGFRLGLLALAKDYGKKDVVYSGPIYKTMKIEQNKIRLSFTHTGSGLASRDGKALSEFELAGKDGKFVAAKATIEGDTVVVSSGDVPNPTQVQFGWRNVANPNLMNKEGLPASPFRSKNWRGATGQ